MKARAESQPQKGVILLVGKDDGTSQEIELVFKKNACPFLAVTGLHVALQTARDVHPFLSIVNLSLVTDAESVMLVRRLEEFSVAGVAFLVDVFEERSYNFAREVQSASFLFPPSDEDKGRILVNGLISSMNRFSDGCCRHEFDTSPKVVPIAVWTQDFSDQRKFLQEIFSSQVQEDIQSFLLKNPHVLRSCVALGKIIDADRHTLDFFGVSSLKELQGLFQSPFSYEEELFLADQYEALLKGKRYFERDLVLTSSDGSPSNSFLIKWSLPCGSSDYSAVHVVALDISSIRRSFFQLELEKKKFEKIFQDSPAGIVIADPFFRTLEVNDAFLHMFGFESREEALSYPMRESIVPPRFHAQAVSIGRMVLEGKKVFLETQRCKRNGETIDVFLNCSPLTMPGGVAAICYLYTDISEKKREEKLLRRKLKVEQMISEVSADILNYPSLEKALANSLHKMASYMEVDRITYLLKKDGQMEYLAEWCARSVPSLRPRLEREESFSLMDVDPWFRGQIEKRDVVYIKDREHLPVEAEKTKRILEEYEICSLVTIPYRFRGEIVGSISFERLNSNFSWTKSELALFDLFSEMLSSLKSRDAAYELLREDREKYRRLFMQIQEPFSLFDVLLDSNGKLHDLRFIEHNEQAYIFLEKYGYGDVIGRTVKELFPKIDSSFEEIARYVVTSGEPRTFVFYSHVFAVPLTVSCFVPQRGRLALLFIYDHKIEKRETRD
ncbi:MULTISPECIES: PAS domain S-box protein [Aminobacterium]|jgi:PAS domain S-box-containing protein|uniref:PAS domain S-box protein n=1 Tax=Aminobacterium TaxID=81466 RepID=UPI000466DF75|nr:MULTISPECIES: PAS domain S-box protein [Aminobacterium]